VSVGRARVVALDQRRKALTKSSFIARQFTSATLLISLNAAFSDGHNVTSVTAEPPKEGADRPTRAVPELTGAPAIFVWGSNQA
jgi:hypothetical protein